MPQAEKILDFMVSEIKKHGLEVLDRYPNDVLVHDLAMLKTVDFPGAKIAWMVGDSHSHMVRLGLHPDENKNVTYLTNLASGDRFYLITITNGGFIGKEVTRDQFLQLQHTPVPYEMQGGKHEFSLYKRGDRIGVSNLSLEGDPRDRVAVGKITPIGLRTKLDLAALQLWTERGLASLKGSLFGKFDIKFQA